MGRGKDTNKPFGTHFAELITGSFLSRDDLVATLAFVAELPCWTDLSFGNVACCAFGNSFQAEGSCACEGARTSEAAAASLLAGHSTAALVFTCTKHADRSFTAVVVALTILACTVFVGYIGLAITVIIFAVVAGLNAGERLVVAGPELSVAAALFTRLTDAFGLGGGWTRVAISGLVGFTTRAACLVLVDIAVAVVVVVAVTIYSLGQDLALTGIVGTVGLAGLNARLANALARYV